MSNDSILLNRTATKTVILLADMEKTKSILYEI